MRYTLSTLAVLSLLAPACTTSKGITPDEPRTAPTVPAPSAPSDELPPPVQKLSLSLGAACKPEDKFHCGTKGRVAVAIEMQNLPSRKARPAPPCDMLPIGMEGSGCVQDDRVYLSGSCMECRQYSRWDMAGVVPEMTDPQLLDAQRRAGIPLQPVLRTADAWRGAIASLFPKNGRKRN